MKSFCKHCGQEYDDLPEEYLNQEVTCGSCGQNYVVIKTIDCIYCGAPNKPDTSCCRECGHALKQQSPSVPKLQPRCRDVGYMKMNSEKIPESSKVEGSEVLCNVSAFDKVGINIYASLTIFFGVISIVFAPFAWWLGSLMFETINPKPLKRWPIRFGIGCLSVFGVLQILIVASGLYGLYKCASVPSLFPIGLIVGIFDTYVFFKFCVIYTARLDAGEVESEAGKGHSWRKVIVVSGVVITAIFGLVGFILILGDDNGKDKEWQSFLSYVTEEDSKRVDKWESRISSNLSYFEFANILERDILPHYRNILNRCNSLNVSKLNEGRKKDYVRIASGTRLQIEGCEEIIKGVRSNDEQLVKKGLQLLEQASSSNSNR